jgi:hypothetical protein
MLTTSLNYCSGVAVLLLLLILQDAPPSSLMALPIALKHSALSTSPKLLCTVSAVCKDWREAVQQCDARNTHVQLSILERCSEQAARPVQAAKLASLSSWLLKHGALVNSMAISTREPTGVQFYVDDTATLMNVLQTAMLTSTAQFEPAAAAAAASQVTRAAAAAGAAAAAAAIATGGTAQQQLAAAKEHTCLQPASLELSTYMFAAPSGHYVAQLQHQAVHLLAVLPPHCLTQLSLEVGWNITAADAAVMKAALARLTCLEQLKASVLPYNCLVALEQLSCLTLLDLDGLQCPAAESGDDSPRRHLADAALQQLLGLPLPLRQLHLLNISSSIDHRALPVLELSNMTNLTELSVWPPLSVGSVLPEGLQRLELTAANGEQLAAIAPLRQLTALTVSVEFKQPEGLLHLASLPKLHLQLIYQEGTSASVVASTASAWGRLPQLCELWIACCDDIDSFPTKQQMAAVLSGLAAATTLTKLTLELQRTIEHAEQDQDEEEDEDSEPVAACAFLARLTRLQHLELVSWTCDTLVPADARALTALTGLTHLKLVDGGKGVGDVVANELACSLTQLRHLALKACDLGDMACLASIGHLKQLTELRLGTDGAGLSEPGRMLLSQLPSLQHLSVT